MILIQPPACLLAGPAGSGKTSAIATQLLCGLEVFVVMTEPDGVGSLLDACERLRAPVDKLHWTYCPPTSTGWIAMEDMISRINSMDQKGLADLRDLGKAGFKPAMMKFLNAFRNFPCERTGSDFGDMTTWDDTRSLNIDSLTGWSILSFGCTVGYKPTANPGEWGIAQNLIYNLLVKVMNDRRCFFNMTAHLEKEMDELAGVKKVMVSTIGAKLAPKIPPFFSEVIKCSRNMDSTGRPSFSWSTIASDMDLKNRALPMGSTMPADFKPVIEAHLRRKKASLVTGSTTLAPPVPSPSARVATAVSLSAAPMSPPMAPNK